MKAPPTLHVVAGPNGAGKTTFYEQVLSRLISFVAGRVAGVSPPLPDWAISLYGGDRP